MGADERVDFECERKGANAERVDMKTVARQQSLGLVHRGRGRPVVNDAGTRRLRRGLQKGTRQQAARRFKFT